MTKRLSIKSKLVGSFGGVLILGLVINGVIATWLCHNLIGKEIQKNLRQRVDEAANSIEVMMLQKQSDIQSLSQMSFMTNKKLSATDKIYYLREINKLMGFEEITLVEGNGKSYGIGKEREEAIKALFEKKALGQSGIYFCTLKDSGNKVVAITAPVRNEHNDYIGTIIGLESLETLGRDLSGMGIDQEFLILDQQAQIISYADGNLLRSGQDSINKESFYESQSLFKEIMNKESGMLLCTHPETKEEVVLSYTPLGSEWVIAIINHVNALRGPVETFYQIIGFSTWIIVILGTLIVYLISRSFSIRMHEIASCLDDVANGDFEQPIPKELLDMQDEMGDVVRALVTMKSEIEDMLSTVKDCTDYMNDQMEDFTGDIREAIKEVVTSHRISTEEASDITERIERLSEISGFIQEKGSIHQEQSKE